MNITISIHEIISWLLTVVIFTLYLIERRKNSTAPIFSALQGILKACRAKKAHLAALAKNIEDDKREAIPKTEVLLHLDIAQTESHATMQQLAGTMKAILPYDSSDLELSDLIDPDSANNYHLPEK